MPTAVLYFNPMTTENFSNQLLIAMPTLLDPNFHHAVAYICNHNEEGAMGIIINQPTDVVLTDILEYTDIDDYRERTDQVFVYRGGPVQPDYGFVIHHHNPLDRWDSTLTMNNEIAVTASRDIITAIAHDTGPKESLVALGYAGWGPGQLEREIIDNSWFLGTASHEILFHLPHDQRWHKAAEASGIDLSRLSVLSGHA